MNFEIGGHIIEFDHVAYLRYMALGVTFILACRVLSYFTQKSLRDSYSRPATLGRTTRGLNLTGVVAAALIWSVLAVPLAVALAEPYETNQPIEVPAGSLHVVFAYDVSPSSEAEDYRDSLPPPALPDGTRPTPVGPWGSRLQVAGWLSMNQIMLKIPGNKIGLVAATADARVVSLLREDYATIRYMLTATDALTAPGGGSDPAESLKAALTILRKQYDPKKRQVIFIFTDGGISDLEEKASPEDKEVWERDFQRTLKELAALKAQALVEGVEPPLVVLVGLGGEEEVMVPLYFTTGERVRNEKGEPEFFPFGAEEKQKTKLVESNILMLKDRISAVTECRYQRISKNWSEVEQIRWVDDVIGGKKGAIGKRYHTKWPLYVAMGLIALLFVRGVFRAPDVIARRRALPGS